MTEDVLCNGEFCFHVLVRTLHTTAFFFDVINREYNYVNYIFVAFIYICIAKERLHREKLLDR